MWGHGVGWILDRGGQEGPGKQAVAPSQSMPGIPFPPSLPTYLPTYNSLSLLLLLAFYHLPSNALKTCSSSCPNASGYSVPYSCLSNLPVATQGRGL